MSRPSPDRLLDGQPEQVARNFFSDSTGQFFAGVWESSAGRWRVSYTENEFCHITRGRVRIEDSQRHCTRIHRRRFIRHPAGFTGIWQVLEPMSKLYVIFEPATR